MGDLFSIQNALNDDINTRLGNKIKAFRKLKGYTQEVLGERSGVSYKFIGEIERGVVNPSLNSLVQIAKALDIHVSELFPSKKEIFPLYSDKDIQLIKKVLWLLNGGFSKL